MSTNGTGPASSREAVRHGAGTERDVTVLHRAEEVRLTMRLRELRREAEELEVTAAHPPDPGAAVSELRVRLGRLLAQRQRLHAEELLQAEARAAAIVAAGRAEAERVLESGRAQNSFAAENSVAHPVSADATSTLLDVVDEDETRAVDPYDVDAAVDPYGVDPYAVDPYGVDAAVDPYAVDDWHDVDAHADDAHADDPLDVHPLDVDALADDDGSCMGGLEIGEQPTADREPLDVVADVEPRRAVDDPTIDVEGEVGPASPRPSGDPDGEDESDDIIESWTDDEVVREDIPLGDVQVGDVHVVEVPVLDVPVDDVVAPAEPIGDVDPSRETGDDGQADAPASGEDALIGDRLLYGDAPIEAALLGATDVDARVLDRRRVALTRLVRSISDQSVLVAPALAGAEAGAEAGVEDGAADGAREGVDLAPSPLGPELDTDAVEAEHLPTTVMPLVASAVTSPWAPPAPGARAESVDARPPALPDGPVDVALREVANRHVAVNLDAEEFAAALAAALAPILAQRAQSMPPGQYRPVREAPTSFWANAKHVDVMLAFVALAIVLAVLFAWML